MSGKSSLSHKFCSMLSLKLPIIQAPMAGVVSLQLAANVSSSGALGSIPASGYDLTKSTSSLVDALSTFKTLLPKTNLEPGSSQEGCQLPANMNFFCHDIVQPPNKTQIENWWSLFIDSYVETFLSTNPGSEKSRLSEIKSKGLLNDVQFSNGNVSFKEFEIATEKSRHLKIANCEDPAPIDELISYLNHHPELTPKVMSFHFGIPKSSTINKLHDLGVTILVTATSTSEARLAIENNVDGLVLQGYQAGGHRGNFLVKQEDDDNLSTMDLFKQVKELLDSEEIVRGKESVYLIPAGGIINGDDIKEYLKLGASAVQMGTAFLGCPEKLKSGSKYAATNSVAKIVSEKIEKGANFQLPSTTMTPLVSGKPARTIVTPFIGTLQKNTKSPGTDLPEYGYRYKAFKGLNTALESAQLDETDIGFYLCGKRYGEIEVGKSAKEIIEKLGEELKGWEA
ncbi:putative nitronate monooxygenase [Saccharomycopsis crataegensis]|uniref:Nitronate monooxygenase n=1 Tax=Saccharomycopsis crataegensis TaxID=43959 RepID=A0AAV5QKQ4_9ASCO|nr:putative nitronate monooxygenase [Saccharomycopsis crataegensis]